MAIITANPDIAPLYDTPDSERVRRFKQLIRESSPWLNGTMEAYLREKRRLQPSPKLPIRKPRISEIKRMSQIRIGRLSSIVFKF
jgi:hypothetical protein